MSTEILAFPSGASSERSPGAGGGAPAAVARPVLVGCSHGTSDLTGREVIRALLDDVRAARPDLDVREAFVDVQLPEVADVVTSVVAPGSPTSDGPTTDGSTADGPTVGGQTSGVGEPGARTAAASAGPRDAVVVPLLLSGGFHVSVDVAESVADRGPGAGRAAAATPLGPDPRLVDLLADRLAEAGIRPDDAVVIAAAGSSRPGAARDVEELATGLRLRHPGPVSVGYGAMAQPSVPDAVTAARADLSPGARVVVAAYLLAPGFFYDRVLEAGGDVVTAPLAPDARLTAIVLDRYTDAAATLTPPAT